MVSDANTGQSEGPFPTLRHVLATYFPSAALGREDREAEFMQAYAERGEDDPEFAGLQDELAHATWKPAEAAPVVNEALGIELTARETRIHLLDLRDRLTNEPPEADYTESEEFPQLQQVLLTYFPSTSGRRNRTIAFLQAYAEHGERKAEFAGLADELRQAVKFPKRAQPMVNEALGLELSSTEVRSELASLLDQLTNPEGEGEEEQEEQPLTAQELLQGWFFRKVNPIPGKFRKYSFPIWAGLAAGLVLIGGGAALLTYLPVPTWLTWIPLLFIVIGFVVMAMFAVTMAALRNELRNPDREKERQAAIAEAAAEREARRERRRKVTRLLGP